MNTQRIQSLFSGSHVGQTLTLQGWVRTFRANRFIAVNDGSTLKNMQCVVDFEQTDEELLTGDTNIEKAYNFLVTREGGNLTSAQAAGVIGNFCVESGANQNGGDINPIAQAPNEGSFGIAQWNPATARFQGLKDMSARLNISYTSLYAQLLWTRTELITHSYLGYGELKQARDPEEAALVFMRKYERPGYEVQSDSSRIKGSDGKDRRLGQDERIEFAQEVYSVFNS